MGTQTVEIAETNQTVTVKSGVPDATKIQGKKLPSNPSDGDVLRFDSGSGEWKHVGQANLDVDVTDLQGDPIPSNPSDNQLLIFDSGSGEWTHIDEADLDPTSLDAGNLTSGSLQDGRVQESNVTQHEGALSIGGSQVDSGTLPDARIQESGVTQHEGAVDHDVLTNFAADEHRAYGIGLAPVGSWIRQYAKHGSGTDVGEDFLIACPIIVGRPVEISTIKVRNESADSASSPVLRIGIYDSDQGEPNNLVAEAGTMDLTQTGKLAITGLSIQLTTPGVYWYAGVAQNVNEDYSLWLTKPSGQGIVPVATGQDMNSIGGITKRQSNVTGSLPDPFGDPTNDSGGGYLMALKVGTLL